MQTTLNQQLRPQNPANTPVAAALFQIQQEIEQTCLTNAQRELEQQSSSDFDRCYIGMQVGMHMQLTSVLSVLKNHVTSPDLKKAIEDASQLIARHLEHAKKIMKELEQGGNNAATTTRKSAWKLLSLPAWSEFGSNARDRDAIERTRTPRGALPSAILLHGLGRPGFCDFRRAERRQVSRSRKTA